MCIKGRIGIKEMNLNNEKSQFMTEGSVRPLSEKLTAKSRRAKIKLAPSVNNTGSHGFKNVQNFEAFEYIRSYMFK